MVERQPHPNEPQENFIQWLKEQIELYAEHYAPEVQPQEREDYYRELEETSGPKYIDVLETILRVFWYQEQQLEDQEEIERLRKKRKQAPTPRERKRVEKLIKELQDSPLGDKIHLLHYSLSIGEETLTPGETELLDQALEHESRPGRRRDELYDTIVGGTRGDSLEGEIPSLIDLLIDAGKTVTEACKITAKVLHYFFGQEREIDAIRTHYYRMKGEQTN